MNQQSYNIIFVIASMMPDPTHPLQWERPKHAEIMRQLSRDEHLSIDRVKIFAEKINLFFEKLAKAKIISGKKIRIHWTAADYPAKDFIFAACKCIGWQVQVRNEIKMFPYKANPTKGAKRKLAEERYQQFKNTIMADA